MQCLATPRFDKRQDFSVPDDDACDAGTHHARIACGPSREHTRNARAQHTTHRPMRQRQPTWARSIISGGAECGASMRGVAAEFACAHTRTVSVRRACTSSRTNLLRRRPRRAHSPPERTHDRLIQSYPALSDNECDNTGVESWHDGQIMRISHGLMTFIRSP